MPKSLRRRSLREKEAKQLLLEFSRNLRFDAEKIFGLDPRVEIVETHDLEVFLVNGKPMMVRFNNVLFPTLIFDKVLSFLPQIVVDMGAVPHVCNGADIMAPGVRRITGKFKESDPLLIIDERHGKPLAIGLALFNSHSMTEIEHGKIVKNIHYIGDKIWKFIKDQ
ncbi:MAG: RNA-binding protein [Candidatus Bathyarchaeota archaeon]|nr:RNA-binding protein [Candidatus Bathyarchaeota archaeon]